VSSIFVPRQLASRLPSAAASRRRSSFFHAAASSSRRGSLASTRSTSAASSGAGFARHAVSGGVIAAGELMIELREASHGRRLRLRLRLRLRG
jgi:hypothetical protein